MSIIFSVLIIHINKYYQPNKVLALRPTKRKKVEIQKPNNVVINLNGYHYNGQNLKGPCWSAV